MCGGSPVCERARVASAGLAGGGVGLAGGWGFPPSSLSAVVAFQPTFVLVLAHVGDLGDSDAVHALLYIGGDIGICLFLGFTFKGVVRLADCDELFVVIYLRCALGLCLCHVY